MDWAKALADAGIVSIVLFGFGTFCIALYKGWLVIGWYYQRELKRADRAEANNEKLTAAVEKMARAHERDASRRRSSDAP